MAERILGLDIGTDTLYAVLLERPTRGKARITQTYSGRFLGRDELDEAIKNLLAQTGPSFSRIVTCLPLSALTMRHLQLPFRDKKKIGAVLPFELASLLPCPLGDAALDFLLIGQGEPQEVLAVLADRASVQERLALLQNNGLAGAIIEGAGFVLGNQAGPYVNQEGLSVILDLGKTEAVSLWLDRGRLCHVRALSWGGGDLPEAGAADDALATLAGEVQSTHSFLQLRGWAEGEIIGVYLTGSGSLSPGITEKLAAALETTVEQLDLARRVLLMPEEKAALDWVPGLMDQALALALRSRSGGIDFAVSQRPGKSAVQWSGSGKTLGIIMLVFLLLIGADAFLDYRLAQKRFFTLKSEVAAVFKRHYPGGGRQVDPVQQMKGLTEQLRKEQAGIADLTGKATTVSVLQELSALIPAGYEVLLHSLTLEEGNMAIKGEARNFETVEKTREALARSPLFSAVTLGATNLQKDGQKVAFDLAIRVTK